MMSLFDSLQILNYCVEPSGTVKSQQCPKMILLPSSSAGHVNLARDPWTMKQVIDSCTFMPSSWVHGDHGMSWRWMIQHPLISLDHFHSRMNFGGAFHRAQELSRWVQAGSPSWRVFVVWRFERRATNDGQLRTCRIHTFIQPLHGVGKLTRGCKNHQWTETSCRLPFLQYHFSMFYLIRN